MSLMSLFYFFFFLPSHLFAFFFFNDPATTEIYTLSLHDALPISYRAGYSGPQRRWATGHRNRELRLRECIVDRKSTRLNSSHGSISYAVFCLKKKKKRSTPTSR